MCALYVSSFYRKYKCSMHYKILLVICVFLKRFIILFMYMYMTVSVVGMCICVQCPQRPEDGDGFMSLELQSGVTYLVCMLGWTWVLWLSPTPVEFTVSDLPQPKSLAQSSSHRAHHLRPTFKYLSSLHLFVKSNCHSNVIWVLNLYFKDDIMVI